jgi:hypothetical protein
MAFGIFGGRGISISYDTNAMSNFKQTLGGFRYTIR